MRSVVPHCDKKGQDDVTRGEWVVVWSRPATRKERVARRDQPTAPKETRGMPRGQQKFDYQRSIHFKLRTFSTDRPITGVKYIFWTLQFHPWTLAENWRRSSSSIAEMQQKTIISQFLWVILWPTQTFVSSVASVTYRNGFQTNWITECRGQQPINLCLRIAGQPELNISWSIRGSKLQNFLSALKVSCVSQTRFSRCSSQSAS